MHVDCTTMHMYICIYIYIYIQNGSYVFVIGGTKVPWDLGVLLSNAWVKITVVVPLCL